MTIGLIFLMSLACVAAALLLLIRVIGLRPVLRAAVSLSAGAHLLTQCKSTNYHSSAKYERRDNETNNN